MISVQGEALDAGCVFGAQISDHAPQQYHVIDREQGDGPCITVYTWNLMGRCRAEQFAGSERSNLSNNGFRLNETVPQYESRLFDQIAPRVCSWLTDVHPGVPVLVCLQEVDAHPRTQTEFLQKLERLCCKQLGHVSSTVGYEHANVSIWLKDDYDQAADPIAIEGDKGMLAIDLTNHHSNLNLRLINVHLPFCGLPDDAGCNDSLSEAKSAILHCVSTAPLGLVIVTGDFNLDMRRLDTSEEHFAHAYSCARDSAMFEDKYYNLDGCIAAKGLGEQGSLAGEVLEKSRSAELFHGFTRSTYMTHSIHYNLQGKVHSLSDDDLFALGLYHFADQPAKLEEFLSKQPAVGKMQLQAEPKSDMFYGKSREEFVSTCIHFNLQDDQLEALSDEDLFVLGCCQFAVQPMKLESLLRAAEEKECNSAQEDSEIPETLFYGCTRKIFIERFISYNLQSKVQDLSDKELFGLGQRDFCHQLVELEQLRGEAVLEQHTTASQAELTRHDIAIEQHIECHGQADHEQKLQSEERTDCRHAPSEISSCMSTEMFHGHTRSSFMKQCIHFNLHGRAGCLKDHELFALGLCHFGVQALKLEALSKKQGYGESGGTPAPDMQTQCDGSKLFHGPSRNDFIQKYIAPELRASIDSLDDESLFRLGRYEFTDQASKLSELTAVIDDAGDYREELAEAGLANTKPKLFHGLTREAFIEKSIRYTLKHRVDQLDDEVLFWLGRQQFCTQPEHLEKLICHIPSGHSKLGSELEHAPQKEGEKIPQSVLPGICGSSQEKLLHGLDRGAFVSKYIHYKLQGRVGRLSDDELFALGKCHFSDQAASFDQTLSNRRSETNIDAMQRMRHQSSVSEKNIASKNTSAGEDARVGTWSYSLAGKKNKYVISKAQDGHLNFREEMSDDVIIVQNIATLVQSAGNDRWFVGQLMRTDTGKIIGMIRVRFEGCQSISNFKATEDETWEKEVIIANKEGSDPMHGLTRQEFVNRNIHHNLQSKAESLDEEDLVVLASCHFSEQNAKLQEMLSHRPQTSNVDATLHKLNGHGLPREEFIKKHIHNKLHGKIHDLTEEELVNLGQLQYAEQFHKLLELRPKQSRQPREKNSSSKSIATLTNAAATLRMIEMSRGVPFRPDARKIGGACKLAPGQVTNCQEVIPVASENLDWSTPPEAEQAQWEDEECWDAPPAADQAQWDEADNRIALSEAAAQIRGSQEEWSPTSFDADVREVNCIEGLGPWLDDMRLRHHLPAIEAWCEEMGAVTLLEVAENIEDLVERLANSGSLKRLEQRRLKQGAISLLSRST